MERGERMNNKFWNWTLDEDGRRKIIIDGEIASECWYEDEVTPALFREELNSGTGDVILYINSPGGDCFAASQIYTMLMEYKGSVTVRIDGIAASAASVIAMAGGIVEMSPTAMMMIHNPATMAWGDVSDMQKAIDVLNEVKESIINAYELKTELSRAKLSRLMNEETWMNARKARDLGFCDRIMGDSDSVAEPVAFSPRSAEDALRRKLVAKYGKKTNETKGRRVDDLLTSLNTMNH